MAEETPSFLQTEALWLSFVCIGTEKPKDFLFSYFQTREVGPPSGSLKLKIAEFKNKT